MTAPATGGPLADLLDQEVALLGDFLKLLDREEQALVAGDADALPPLAQTKNQLAEGLASVAARRGALLTAAGLPESRGGVETLIARQPQPNEIRHRWEKLLDLAREARRRNEFNGRLIAEKLGHNQQALHVLSAAAERAALYGPDGQTQIGGSGRSLGSA